MPLRKRKRESLTDATSNELETSSDTTADDTTGEAAVFTPFTIEYLKSIDAKPKKRKVGGKSKTEATDHAPGRIEPTVIGSEKAIAYTVIPGSSWEAMNKYKNFIVNGKQFSMNDFVYINNSETSQEEDVEDDRKFWIARVLEVRAKDEAHVYLRVYWMYWPEELPNGREYYHGKAELVASNHMEIIDAMTVSDKAEVEHIVEQDDAPIATGLYWRQSYDFVSGKVSVLKQDCICKKFQNPDKLLIHCPNSKCGKWLHEDCVLDDTAKRAWSRLTAMKDSEEPTGGITKGVDGIQVSQADGRRSNGLNGSSDRPKPSSKKRRKSKVVEDGPLPWEGKIQAQLEMEAGDEEEDETTEITGRAVLTDLREPGTETWTEDLECIVCHEPLK